MPERGDSYGAFAHDACDERVNPMTQSVDMCSTCKYVLSMSRMIQIRNVPDDLHGRLKSRAALEGMSLSDYLLREVGKIADRPEPGEMRERLRARGPVRPRVSPAQAVRKARARR